MSGSNNHNALWSGNGPHADESNHPNRVLVLQEVRRGLRVPASEKEGLPPMGNGHRRNCTSKITLVVWNNGMILFLSFGSRLPSSSLETPCKPMGRDPRFLLSFSSFERWFPFHSGFPHYSCAFLIRILIFSRKSIYKSTNMLTMLSLFVCYRTWWHLSCQTWEEQLFSIFLLSCLDDKHSLLKQTTT